MIREIIKIDEDLCNGCGACIPACVEGALQIVNGKAKLVKEIYCDGLGACLGDCPTGALTIEKRESDEFDEAAVEEFISQKKKEEASPPPPAPVHHGCPGSAMQNLASEVEAEDYNEPTKTSQLGHWPVQLMLVNPAAPFMENADLLICADCVPFTVPDFHQRYLKGRAVAIGCPKLDDIGHYREKLAEIFAVAKPKSITVLRMEVPCCGGISHAVIEARDKSLPDTPVDVHVIGVQGDIQCGTM